MFDLSTIEKNLPKGQFVNPFHLIWTKRKNQAQQPVGDDFPNPNYRSMDDHMLKKNNQIINIEL